MTALVDYNIIFLDKSWYWLNDPEIKALTMTPDFSKEDQASYFKSLPKKYRDKDALAIYIENIEDKTILFILNDCCLQKIKEHLFKVQQKKFRTTNLLFLIL